MNNENSLARPRRADSQQLVFQEISSPDYQQWVLHDRAEVISVLSTLQATHARANVYFSQPPGSCVTSILSVDSARSELLFDPDIDPVRNNGMASSNALAWKSSIEGVKVEFISGPVRWTELQGAAVFSVEIPDQVLRLQRRNAFRTPTTVGRPIFVHLEIDSIDSTNRRARVLNISALGMCVLIDAQHVPVIAGTRFAAAHFELPGYGEVRCDLEVRYIGAAGAGLPSNFRRCGIQFIRLAHADEILIARYVNDMQRARIRVRDT